MRKLGVIAAALAITIAVATFLHREPRYKGKSLTTLLLEYVKEAPPYKDGKDSPIIGLRAIGPAACPHLLRMMKAEETTTGDFVRKIRGFLGLRDRALSAGDLHVLARAGFGLLGKDCPEAVPELGKLLLTREDIASHVAFALGQMGPSSAATLVAGVKSPNLTISQCSTLALGGLGTNGAIILPYLSEILEQKDYTRMFAVRSVAEMGPASKELLPVLISLLSDANATEHVALPLARFGETGRIALIDATTNQNAAVGTSALAALIPQIETFGTTVAPARGEGFWSLNTLYDSQRNLLAMKSRAKPAGELVREVLASIQNPSVETRKHIEAAMSFYAWSTNQVL